MNATKLVPERHRRELRDLAKRSRETILLAALVGALTGAAVALMDWLTVDEGLSRVLDLPPVVRNAIPLVGLAVVAIVLRVGGRISVSTSDEYIKTIHGTDELDLAPAPRRLVAGMVSVAAGVPFGLEAASMYLGASVGSAVRRRFRSALGSTDMHSLMVAGAAAGVAAIFKAPATGAVFALEVPYRDDLGRHLLIPALVGSATGYLAFVGFHGTDPLLLVRGDAPFDLRDLLGAVVLGVGVGLIVRAYAKGIRMAKAFQQRRPAWLTVGAGGLAVCAAVTVSHLVLGGDLGMTPGYNVIEWATEPKRALGAIALLLAIRLVGTVGTLAGGGVVGLFLPLVVAGALIGRFVGGAIDAPNLTVFIILGVAAGLSAGYRVPLAAVMFIAEASGRPGYIVPGLLAAVGADLVMGASSVTPYQQ
ncbi:MAG: chloride channel protein [Acidimicrobiales bacterium]